MTIGDFCWADATPAQSAREPISDVGGIDVVFADGVAAVAIGRASSRQAEGLQRIRGW
jgi:hypothetical protein